MNRIDEHAESGGNDPAGCDIEVPPQILVRSSTASRRAWLRRGVAIASPVVISLVSAPVRAENLCLLPSGFISTATFNSRHPGALNCVGNMGPSFWSANFANWPTATPDTQMATFISIFGGFEPSMTATTTLQAALNGASTTPLAKYCIAAYLNARSGTAGFPLTAAPVQTIWKSYHGGPFSTLLVSGWTEANTVTWLQSLMSP